MPPKLQHIPLRVTSPLTRLRCVARYELELSRVKLDKSRPGEEYREYYDADKVELLATFGLPRGDKALMAMPEADKLVKAYSHVHSLNELRVTEGKLGNIRHGRFSQVVRYYMSVGGGGRFWADCVRVCLDRRHDQRQ